MTTPRSAGRPEVGGLIGPTRLGDDLLAKLDAYADETGQTRAEAIRALLEIAFHAGPEITR